MQDKPRVASVLDVKFLTANKAIQPVLSPDQHWHAVLFGSSEPIATVAGRYQELHLQAGKESWQFFDAQVMLAPKQDKCGTIKCDPKCTEPTCSPTTNLYVMTYRHVVPTNWPPGVQAD